MTDATTSPLDSATHAGMDGVGNADRRPVRQEEWEIKFRKLDSGNPAIGPNGNPVFGPNLDSVWRDRRSGREYRWEENIQCPGATVHEGKVALLYRAGRQFGPAVIGLAWSTDGILFQRHGDPVFFPDNDFMDEAATSDPHVFWDETGTCYMLYTSIRQDSGGRITRIAEGVATSTDLVHWEKRGPIFERAEGGRYKDYPSKSAVVVCQRDGDRLVAARIGGKYWMYYGDGRVDLATSDNLLDWVPSGQEVLPGRPGRFDQNTEVMVMPFLCADGIMVIYSGFTPRVNVDGKAYPFNYTSGQALFDRDNPGRLLKRSETPFMKYEPERPEEAPAGQSPMIVGATAMTPFRGNWLLYYDIHDTWLGLAIAPIDARMGESKR